MRTGYLTHLALRPPVIDTLAMEDAFDKFRDVVQRGLKYGQTARREKARYIPAHILHEHWDEAHVNEILYATAEQLHVLPIDVICEKYSRVFSVIVYISRTDRSYVRYMTRFIRHQRDDISLPLTEKPTFLSDDDDAEDFFRAFSKHQWKFCPASLGPSRIYDRELDPRQILPFCPVGGTVSSKHDWGHASVHCVEVDPSAQLRASKLVRVTNLHLFYCPRQIHCLESYGVVY